MKLLSPFLLRTLEGLAAVSLSPFPFLILTSATTSGKKDAPQSNTIEIIYGRAII